MVSRLLHLKHFLKDPDKKPILRIAKEAMTYGFIKKEFPTDYFRKFLYRKEIVNYKSYLSLGEFYKIIDSPKILDPDMASILENKLSFALFAQKQGIPIPKLFGFNIKRHFFSNEKEYQVTSPKELLVFLTAVFEDNNLESLFLKPISGIGGQGCMLINKLNLQDRIQLLSETLLNSNYIFQEKIVQHSTINKIHSKSINTIRANTYLDTNGQPHLISALMRFGCGDLVTDNEGSGGFYIAVDLDSERLKGVGRQSIVKGGTVFTHHPDSGVQLDGFELPLINEVIALAKSAATKIPTRIIGWDIALSVEGPLIIEGNSNPSLNMADIAYGGYCDHPLVKQILSEVTK